MYLIIAVILIIFILALTAIWIWYAQNETEKEPDLFDLAMNAFNKKDFGNAESFLSKFLAAQPNSAEARLVLGQVYMKLSNYDKAKECYEKLLKTSPKDEELLFRMAQVLEGQQSYEEAKEHYKMVIQENPSRRDAQINIGKVNLKQGNYQEASEIFEKTISEAPDNIEASFCMAKCKTETCDFSNPQEAQQLINEYLKISSEPNLPKEFDVTLAQVYAKTGQVDKTIAACQRALECDAENVEAYKILGLVQLVTKDFKTAENTLSTGLNLDPSNKEMHEILSYVLCRQKDRCEIRECRNKYMATVDKFLGKKA